MGSAHGRVDMVCRFALVGLGMGKAQKKGWS